MFGHCPHDEHRRTEELSRRPGGDFGRRAAGAVDEIETRRRTSR